MTGIDVSTPRAGGSRLRGSLPARRGSVAWLLVLVLVGGFVLFSIGRQVYASWAIGREADQVRAQIADIEAQNERYRAELEYLQSPAFISAEARRLRNIGLDGEHVLIIPPGMEVAPPATAAQQEAAPPPLLEQWLGLFFGH